MSVVALMMASADLAPVAMAQEPADVDLQSVTLGPGGVRGGGAASGWCQTTGSTAFTIVVFAESPFRIGEVTVMGDGALFDTQTGANIWTQFGPEEFWLR